MKRKIATTFEGTEALHRLGANLRIARLRRAETEAALGARLGVTRNTISRLEQGDAGVAFGLVVEVLLHYGFAEQLFRCADPDSDGVGKRLENLARRARGRAAPSKLNHKIDPTKL